MKNKEVLFSIIVPAYNSAAFINKCVDSVLDQTYPGFELILVDDGSTDDTLEICNAYKERDPRVRVIHRENGGHTSARNEGLKESSGEYILFLDSDDWFEKQTLELCKNEIVSHNSDIVVFRMQNSNDDIPFSILISDGCYDISDVEKTAQSGFIIGADGRFVFPKSLSAKCFRRTVIFKIQTEIPKEIRVGEDGAAFIGAILGAKRISVIANNKEACYYCLVRVGSVSRQSDPVAFKRAAILLSFYNKILKDTRGDFSKQFHRYVVAQLYTAALLVMRSGGGKKELDAGMDEVLKDPAISLALKKASFNLKGYKFIIKKAILRYRMWWLAKLIDRVDV